MPTVETVTAEAIADVLVRREGYSFVLRDSASFDAAIELARRLSEAHGLRHEVLDADALAVAMLGEWGRGVPSAVSDSDVPPELTEDELRERMSGNLCRCGAYTQIVEAVSRVVMQRKETP